MGWMMTGTHCVSMARESRHLVRVRVRVRARARARVRVRARLSGRFARVMCRVCVSMRWLGLVFAKG